MDILLNGFFLYLQPILGNFLMGVLMIIDPVLYMNYFFARTQSHSITDIQEYGVMIIMLSCIYGYFICLKESTFNDYNELRIISIILLIKDIILLYLFYKVYSILGVCLIILTIVLRVYEQLYYFTGS